MSSSQIRSFRHTATVIALEAETALCEVAAAVDKESEVVARQREGEKKRKGPKAGNPRLKELDTKAQEVKRRQNKLKSFIKEFVDGYVNIKLSNALILTISRRVFVHRFRDLDPNIRAECVRSIGLWLRKYPDHFLDAHYLRYVGWVLSDANNHVRLEAVKALSGVYDQAEFIPSLTHFTERFKSRLLEMATSDVDLSIRVAVIRVLGDIEGHFPLEDEEKEKLCLLLFDEEAKVRKAVSQFVHAVWEEEVVAQVGTQSKPSDKDKERTGIKVLAQLLVKWGKALDTLAGEPADSEIGDDARDGEDAANGTSRRANRRKEVIALIGAEDRGRVALAVDALWEEVEIVSQWEELLDLLLLDHSASGEESQLEVSPRARVRANGKKRNDDFLVDEAWRLEEVEESILLEVLVAALGRAKEEAVGGKKVYFFILAFVLVLC
jgi:cohesin complex subunit SA-1/2